jgi:hypothetical protein
LRTQPKARLALAVLAACSQLGVAAYAGGPPVAAIDGHSPLASAWSCSAGPGLGTALPDSCKTQKAVPADEAPQLTLPVGSQQCPDSGPQATCHVSETTARPAPGVASSPAGTVPCPAVAGKPGPRTPASCNDTLLTAPELSGPGGRFGTPIVSLPVAPSVPVESLAGSAPAAQHRVSLSSDAMSLQPGQSALLTATASGSMTGTSYAIEIFDETTKTLVGACTQASQCVVNYAAKSGAHTFVAFITRPTEHQPAASAGSSSSPVTVVWLGVKLATTSASIVGPGKSVTFTATATADFGKAGYLLGLYDQATGSRLTYCSQGTTCSTTLTKSSSGKRSIVAYLAGSSQSLPPPGIQAQSASITATWLGVSLTANTTHPRPGGTVLMQATANADLTNTPWSLGIYDAAGNLVIDSCKSGSTCGARIQIPAGPLPWFTAVIGAVRPLVEGLTAPKQLIRTVQTHGAFIDVQARSAPLQPTRLLWGVDSCKPLGNDASGYSLYGQVARLLGTPDFWGRYMTRTYNCPGISASEISTAAAKHLGILPIYNDYDCNAVRTYNVGLRYATEATAAAVNLGIPQGSVVAVDIEPYGEQCPGAARVDAAFIEGWYDGVMMAGYIPLFYGNGTAGSEFGNAWCRAVKERPEVAVDSFLWTFQPSLVGRFTKARAPEFTPYSPGCAGNFAAWQYMLSAGSRPDVDHDEALSTLPLWYPKTAS